MAPLPVLLYHSVNNDPPAWIAPLTVGPRAFADQMDALLANGRVPVTAKAVAEARHGGTPLPEHAVAVTFDDGFRDFQETALPILDERGIPATLFVTTGALAPLNRSMLPAADMLSLQDVVHLDRAGIDIGAHAHFHAQLDTLDEPALLRELSFPRRILEDALGREVTTFAYPHGFSSKAVRELTRLVGYRAAFAARDAFSPHDDDPFNIARLTVRSDVSPTRFNAWMCGTGAPVSARKEDLRTTAYRYYRRGKVKLNGLTRA